MKRGTNLSLDRLFETVINHGLCIGCGACAAVEGSGLKIQLDPYGCFRPIKYEQATVGVAVSAVCPFADNNINEDDIAKEIFSDNSQYYDQIGFYSSLFAGYVSEGDYRECGSSGGIGSWVLCELLSKDLIDGVFHVHTRARTEDDTRIFQFQLSTTIEDIRNAAKSRYYPVEMSQVLKFIREHPGRYAIVGVPCFIKAVRLLSHFDPIINNSIRFCLALVCGHLKSARYAEMLAWQCGIDPDCLHAIDFRKKISGVEANLYGVEVKGEKSGEMITRCKGVSDLYGTDWGLGLFKYKSCDYCDDVFGETADMAVGDAWLPRYIKQFKGTNIVVVRNTELDNLIKSAFGEGRLKLDKLSPKEVVASQAGGLFHRREGLAYRLYLTDKLGEWRPHKRVEPSKEHLVIRLRRKHEMRPKLSEKSHVLFAEALNTLDFDNFINRMSPFVQQYYTSSDQLWKRVAKFAYSHLKIVVGRFCR